MKIGEEFKTFNILQLPKTKMKILKTQNQISIIINKNNDYFNYSQVLTVTAGVRFVDMSINVESELSDVSIIAADFLLHTKGELVESENSVGFIDEGVKVLGQIIFDENELKYTQVTVENPSGLNLKYLFNDGSRVKLNLSIGVFSVSNNPEIYKSEEIRNHYCPRRSEYSDRRAP